MAATFNAEGLTGSVAARVQTTRPAAASAGGVAPSGDVGAAAAVGAHEALTDPHPQYLTPAEGDAAYDALGAAAAAVSAHTGATDPHGDRAHSDAADAAHVAAANPHTQYAQIAALRTTRTPPATSTSTGTQGELAQDASYLYVCTATDTWKRIALTTF